MKVFLSYRMGVDGTVPVVRELSEFLRAWGISVYVAPKHEGDTVHADWRRHLLSSNFFYQLFTNYLPDERSPMAEERKAWIAKRSGDKFSGSFLYTSETQINHPSFVRLRLRGYPCCDISTEQGLREALRPVLARTARGQIPMEHVRLPRFGQHDGPVVDLNKIGEFIHNFRGVYDKGLDAVFADREAVRPRLAARIKRLGMQKGVVRLLGFTLHRYLIRRGEDSFVPAIKGGARVEVLQLNPNSRAARHRAKIENPGKPFDQSMLKKHGDKVRRRYADHRRVQIAQYDHPYAGMILFDDEAYVELYHVGQQIADRNLCGEVPILVVTKKGDGSLYDIFSNHFERFFPRRRTPKISM